MTPQLASAPDGGHAAAVERLREVVLDLDRAKQTEKSLREETAALLEGLRAIAEARSADELFSRLLGAMRGPLASDVALVVADRSGDGRMLSVIASTDPAFAAGEVVPGKTLARALGGRVTTLLDTAVVAELCVPPFDRIRSCVLLPLAGASSRALILFGADRKQAFGPRQEQLVKRLAPLANQALREVERSEAIARAHLELQAEVVERKRVETELRLAQKLEAVGKLASGIAHEINTPVQYVSDNVAYVAAAFDSMRAVIERILAASRDGDASKVQSLAAACASDLDGFLVEVPHALAESIEGLERVASIVSALRSFSHPSRGLREPFDLNQALTTTITVARNEWRYLADVVTELDPALPPVVGIRDELGQVFLNLIVNAAHAIADAKRGGLGQIHIRTRHADGWVTITVADDGTGIPEAIRDRVFELFFTTKEVGRGSGQGLAIVRTIIDKHGGTVTVTSEVGVGSTFEVRIPVVGG